jgi:hypothetical protein
MCTVSFTFVCSYIRRDTDTSVSSTCGLQGATFR